MSLCVESTRRVLARQPEVLAAFPQVRLAFSPRGGQPRRPEVWAASPWVLRASSLRGERPGQPAVCRPLPGCSAPFPSAASGSGGQRFARVLHRAQCASSLRGERLGRPEVCAHSPPGSVRLFLPRRAARAARGLVPSPQARRRSGPRKSLDRNRGLFAGWEGVASLGLSLPLSPPPASYLQRGWGGSSLESLSPSVLRTAGGVFGPVNFSLALPKFKKGSLRLLSGPSGQSLPCSCKGTLLLLLRGDKTLWVLL